VWRKSSAEQPPSAGAIDPKRPVQLVQNGRSPTAITLAKSICFVTFLTGRQMTVPYPRRAAEHCAVFHFPRASEGIVIVNFTINKEGLTSTGQVSEEFIAKGSRSRHEPMEGASRSEHSQCPLLRLRTVSFSWTASPCPNSTWPRTLLLLRTPGLCDVFAYRRSPILSWATICNPSARKGTLAIPLGCQVRGDLGVRLRVTFSTGRPRSPARLWPDYPKFAGRE
jgi:hypothetical protein